MTVSRTSDGGNTALPRADVNHAGWDAAEAAYQAEDFAKADQLFTRIYKDLDGKGTYDEKLLCFNRIAKCQEMIRRKASPGDAGRIDERGRPIPVESGRERGTQGIPVGRSSEAGKVQTTGVVYLRRTQFEIDGLQAYALEDNARKVIYYATVEKGVGVEAFIGRACEATGSVTIRGDVRGVPYMSISRLTSPR
jgi:hypothetical protein